MAESRIVRWVRRGIMIDMNGIVMEDGAMLSNHGGK